MNDLKTIPSVLSIAIVVAGLIGIISVFLVWISSGNGVTSTGWEYIFRQSSGGDGGGAMFDFSRITENFYPGSSYPQIIFGWEPILVLIFSAVALIFGAYLIFKPKKELVPGVIISGILVVIAALSLYRRIDTFNTQISNFNTLIPDTQTPIMSNFAGIGLFFAMAAGILLILFGVLRLAVKDKTN